MTRAIGTPPVYFLVRQKLESDVDGALVSELRPAEWEYAQSMYSGGWLRCLWKSTETSEAVGLWAAPDERALRELLDGLPMGQMSEFSIEKVVRHPALDALRNASEEE